MSCIAPILAAKIFGKVDGIGKVKLTLGKTKSAKDGKGEEWPYHEAINDAEKLGAVHIQKAAH